MFTLQLYLPEQYNDFHMLRYFWFSRSIDKTVDFQYDEVSMFMEFCESGLMQIQLSLVFPIVRNSYPKGCLKTILMVGFLIRNILSANISGILLNKLLVFIHWLFIDKVLNFQDLRHIFIDMVSPACWYT